jgi:hypothetical protein
MHDRPYEHALATHGADAMTDPVAPALWLVRSTFFRLQSAPRQRFPRSFQRGYKKVSSTKTKGF